MNAKAMTAAFADADEYKQEPPQPLLREASPPEPFPVDALGATLGSAAEGIQEKTQAPIAMCGQSVLAAATLAAQAHADVELPTGQVRPVSSFFMSVAASGERKSAVDGEATWAVRKYEKALRAQTECDASAYLNAKTAWDKVREETIKRHKGDQSVLVRALGALGPAPIAPLDPMMLCDEPTFEGLCRMLGSGMPSVGLFSAEGGQFIGGHGMNDESKMRTAAGLSLVWDGNPIRRVRVGDGATFLPGRRVSLHLMAQPDVAAVMLSDRMLLDQGLLSRVLVTAPASTAGARLWREPTERAHENVRQYSTRLIALLEKPLPLAPGKRNELEPRALPLSPAARAEWIAFVDAIEVELRAEGKYAPVSGLANKAPEHAGRIAAVLQLLDDDEAPTISPQQMQAGIELCRHYLGEALRLFDVSRINAGLWDAQKLLTWLHKAWNLREVSLPDIYQFGPNAFRDKATAHRLVGILEDHGWIERLEGDTTINGHRRKVAWRIRQHQG